MSFSKSEIFAIERPDDKLLKYYFFASLPSFILFPIVFLGMYFKFKTLRYKFDEKGITMSWGIMFKHETFLTYKRIQDIHLTRNLFERWMGLGTLQVQTASGSAGAEMSIVGILQLESLRDFIYTQMKGHEDDTATSKGEGSDEKLSLLREIRDELQQLNGRLEARDV